MKSVRELARAVGVSLAGLVLVAASCAPAAAPAPAAPAQPSAPAPRQPAPSAPSTAPAPAAPQPTAPSAPLPAASAPRNPTPTPATAAQQRKRGGTIVYAQHVDLLNTDPLLCASSSCVVVVGQAFNKLLQRDKNNEIITDLAESWKQTDDVTYTITLRKGVLFHDGTEVTADDVVYSAGLLSQQATHPTYASLWPQYAGARAIDKYTVELKTKQPDPLFPHALSEAHQFIVPKAKYTQSGAFSQKWVGTGPFELKEFTRSVNYKLVKNARYFEQGVPYADGVSVLIVPDLATRVASFRTKRVDVIGELRAPDLVALRRAVPDLNEIKSPGGAIGIYFNPFAPPFDNENLRKAVVFGLQRQQLIDIVTQGTGVMSGVINGGPSGWGLAWYPDEMKKLYTYDPAKVKKFLADGGQPNGFSFTLAGSPRQPLGLAALEVVEQQLSPLGIKARLENQDFTTFIDNRNKLKFQAMSHIVSASEESGPEAERWFHSRKKQYGNDKELDVLIEKMIGTMDPAKRKDLVNQIDKMIVEKGFAGVYFQQLDLAVSQPYVKDYNSPSFVGQYLLRYAWLDK